MDLYLEKRGLAEEASCKSPLIQIIKKLGLIVVFFPKPPIVLSRFYSALCGCKTLINSMLCANCKGLLFCLSLWSLDYFSFTFATNLNDDKFPLFFLSKSTQNAH